MHTDNHKEHPRERILLVDDHYLLTRILSRFLTTSGFEVRTEGTVEGAIATMKAWLPTALVVDQHLPDGLGEHLFDFARSLGVQHIVSMSGSTQPEDLDTIRLAGADLIVPKPFRGSALSRALKGLIEGNAQGSVRISEPGM